ncbi:MULTISPECIES: hypothetical protein [Parachlamydia]|uniref:Uncharacterized protein n=2 Tax=Parachlamydia acanthamoebae TaxID=83552 RepID=F8L1N4_PARAV|nr:hypothetical protein [Parachlamydia acanthamoebae]KIA77143.1 hypothetical protein DB43_GU00360 [Parachlamydia acanthamoebae]CCB87183.1 putative uncharacterized protein [Parachlamydia acanthamoebae UV-7]
MIRSGKSYSKLGEKASESSTEANKKLRTSVSVNKEAIALLKKEAGKTSAQIERKPFKASKSFEQRFAS